MLLISDLSNAKVMLFSIAAKYFSGKIREWTKDKEEEGVGNVIFAVKKRKYE